MHKIGYSQGLVWTPTGSHLVQIKAHSKKGTGRLKIISDIGPDFYDSLENALRLAAKLTNTDLEKINLTLTIPGMIDGSSAGLALFIAIYSAFTKKPVIRNIAFIGALSSIGIVEEVDGVLDKLTAAYRARLKSVIIPFPNFCSLPYKAFPDMFIGGAVNTANALIYAFC